jgi:hypothetical protein
MSQLARVLGASKTSIAPPPQPHVFTRGELDFVIALACSLDESPDENWVQKYGGLPDYVCRIARAIKRSGKTTSQAIAIAISRCKKWASGVGVDAGTQAKAAKAVAQWEALKTKAKSDNKVKATNTGGLVLCLAATTSYNVDIVRRAFESREREARKAWREANPSSGSYYDEGPGHLYVREQWTDFLIVERGYGSEAVMYKVGYSVDDKLDVTFSDPVEVKTEYVAVDTMDGDEMSDADLQKMISFTGPCVIGPSGRSVERVALTAVGRQSPLDKVLALIKGPDN